jgi:hypothetical protein
MLNGDNFEAKAKNDELSVEELDAVSAAGVTLTVPLVDPITLKLTPSGSSSSSSSSSGSGSSSNLGWSLAQAKTT